MPMVSVIIPYYNNFNTLKRALDSVCAQSYQDFEIILINDGSLDQSQQVVEEYIKKHPDFQFRHFIQNNNGPSAARNNGIQNAEGKYIAFLDADDTWEPKKLEIQIGYMEDNRDVAITGTNCYIVKDKKQKKYSNISGSIEVGFYRLLFKSFYLTPTVVVRSEVFFQDDFWFKVGKDQGEDLLLFIQIIRKYRGGLLFTPLANIYKFEYGEYGLSGDLKKLLIHELDNMKILYLENQHNQKKISFSLFIMLNIYTYLKHIKRVLLTSWHNTGLKFCGK